MREAFDALLASAFIAAGIVLITLEWRSGK
jgi:hypothetical protein